MNDVLSLVSFATIVVAAAILIAALFVFASGQLFESHFGRSVAPALAVGAFLVWLVSEVDPTGVDFAVVLWFGAVILAGVYGTVLDAWAWLRGDYQ